MTTVNADSNPIDRRLRILAKAVQILNTLPWREILPNVRITFTVSNGVVQWQAEAVEAFRKLDEAAKEGES